MDIDSNLLQLIRLDYEEDVDTGKVLEDHFYHIEKLREKTRSRPGVMPAPSQQLSFLEDL